MVHYVQQGAPKYHFSLQCSSLLPSRKILRVLLFKIWLSGLVSNVNSCQSFIRRWWFKLGELGFKVYHSVWKLLWINLNMLKSVTLTKTGVQHLQHVRCCLFSVCFFIKGLHLLTLSQNVYLSCSMWRQRNKTPLTINHHLQSNTVIKLETPGLEFAWKLMNMSATNWTIVNWLYNPKYMFLLLLNPDNSPSSLTPPPLL